MRYILPGLEIRMGLPAFKEVEAAFAAQPVRGVDAARRDLSQQLKDANRILLEGRSRSISDRVALNQAINDVLRAGHRQDVVFLRVELIRHIAAIDTLYQEATAVMMPLADEYESLGRQMVGGDAANRRFGRKSASRLAQIAREEVEYRRQYQRFLVDDLLPRIDAHLREGAPSSFDDAVQDAFRRYPRVIEYLGN